MESENNMNYKKVIESILFVSGEPVHIDVISNVIDKEKEQTIEIINDIIESSESEKNSFEILKIGNKYQLSIKKDVSDIVTPIFDKRQNPKLSNQAMEVLSIIAYNSDVTRAQIEMIRGVACDGIVNKLLEYGLITESGRKETLGRPMGYKVTDKFMITFGIKDLRELPKLEEINIEGNDE